MSTHVTLDADFPCEVQADLRIGGTITLTFPGDERDTAEITELDPPKALGFTWAGERLRWPWKPTVRDASCG